MTHSQVVRDAIRAIPDFPKPGILFRDITPVMENPAAFQAAMDGTQDLLAGTSWDKVVAVESRGFIFGAPLALACNKPMVLMRKAGKLPGPTQAMNYSLEYGEATLEIHDNSIQPGEKVLIIDDLLATGGTACAAKKLIEQVGGVVAGYCFLVELDALQGRQELGQNIPVFSLVHY